MNMLPSRDAALTRDALPLEMWRSKHAEWLSMWGAAALLTILGVLTRHDDNWELLLFAIFVDAVIAVWWLEQVGAP